MPQNELPPVIPPDSVLGDPQRRERLEREAVNVAKLTALLALVTRAIPGPAGKVFSVAIAGLEKSPETGRVRPGPHTPANFLPSPIGFLDPEAVGLQRNFWLPPGSTEYVPRFADRLGIGLPQQRIEDELRRERLDRAALTSREATARQVVGPESDVTLRALVDPAETTLRERALLATSGVPNSDLAAAARAELERRGAAPPPPTGPLTALAANLREFRAEADALRAAATGSADGVIPPARAGGPVDPTDTPATTFDQQNAENGAKPPMKNLATERADP